MIGYRFDLVKSAFNPKPIADATERAKYRNFQRFGVFVRTRAISSMLGHNIRKGFGVKSKVTNRVGSSPPGEPPTPHTGLLIKFIWAVVERVAGKVHNVIIGPERLGGHVGNAPEALEKGGQTDAITRVHKKREKLTVTLKARPYMDPAFQAELKTEMPKWKDTIKP